MKNNKKIPEFKDEELYSRWIDEIYRKGRIEDYLDMKHPSKRQNIKYSLAFNDDSSENILIGIRLERRIINFAKKYSTLRGMTYQSVLKDWIANGYLASLSNLRQIKSSF